MNSPRFPIKTLLFLVALAALDFGAIRAMNDSVKAHTVTEFALVLLFGCLLPANLLVLEKLFRREPANGRWHGFDRVGLSALLVWVGLATIASEPIIVLAGWNVSFLIGGAPEGPLVFVLAVLLLSAPPIVLRLMLKRLFRRYEVSFTIKRRQGPVESPVADPDAVGQQLTAEAIALHFPPGRSSTHC